MCTRPRRAVLPTGGRPALRELLKAWRTSPPLGLQELARVGPRAFAAAYPTVRNAMPGLSSGGGGGGSGHAAGQSHGASDSGDSTKRPASPADGSSGGLKKQRLQHNCGPQQAPPAPQRSPGRALPAGAAEPQGLPRTAAAAAPASTTAAEGTQQGDGVELLAAFEVGSPRPLPLQTPVSPPDGTTACLTPSAGR